ncbi:MAG: FlgD immunoglobulin-like domain containing protein, partial [Candidatus Eiseniibacteriota bacterium]
PMAIVAGRTDGVNTRDLYVADAHNRRIVHLHHEGSRLRWIGETRHDASLVTSLATDQWGNVYAASPQAASVTKFSPALERVAELTGDLSHPRSFHVPFVNIRDHRNGSITRAGQPNGVSVDQWSDRSGVGLWKLGVELSALAVEGGDRPVAHFTLTDRAAVTLQVADAGSGRTLASRSLGALPAGLHTVLLSPEDLMGARGGRDLILKLTAASSYANGPSDVAQTRFQAGGAGAAALPSRPVLLGSTPNPMTVSTRIGMVLPAAGAERATLGLFDASGRRLRTWSGFTPGLNEVAWDGTDDRGRAAKAGVYFYRVELDGVREAGRIALVR